MPKKGGKNIAMDVSEETTQGIDAPASGAGSIADEYPLQVEVSSEEQVQEKESDQDQRKLRRNLNRYFIVTVVTLCLYTFTLDHITQLNKIFPSASYVTTGITILFVSGMIFLIFKSGYPLSQFGITIKNWRRSIKESVLLTVPFLLLMLAAKWYVIHFIPGYKDIPLFNFHANVVNMSFHGTPYANKVWIETLLLYVLVIAPLQELVSRGGFQSALQIFLTSKYRAWVAIFVTSFVFATTHLAYPIHIVFLSFVGGLFWGWLYYRHKTLIGAWISHAMIGLWFFWFLGVG